MTNARTDGARRMRTWAALLALLYGAAPATAAAGIKNSPHDLGSGNTTPGAVKAVSESETCKFCHIPHNAQSTRLLWNHKASTYAGPYTWGIDEFGDPVTTTGYYLTPLPTDIRPESKRCISCHDGSISVGDMTAESAAINSTGRTSSGRLTGAGMVVGAGGDLTGEHPVGIPYAGQTYNSITSGVPAAKVSTSRGGYWPVQTIGCQSPSGVCTSATGGTNVNGAGINLIPNSGSGTSNVGVECITCHDPHNTLPYRKFLRVDDAYDGLCNSCHNK